MTRHLPIAAMTLSVKLVREVSEAVARAIAAISRTISARGPANASWEEAESATTVANNPASKVNFERREGSIIERQRALGRAPLFIDP